MARESLGSHRPGSRRPTRLENAAAEAVWPDRYDEWFRTPIGALVMHYESLLLLDLLLPRPGEMILDVGCGTGIFTLDILESGPGVVGLEISLPMLMPARQKTGDDSFHPITGDMLSLPFADDVFDKTVSKIGRAHV